MNYCVSLARMKRRIVDYIGLGIATATALFLLMGFVIAQTQDYLNGQFNTQIASLNFRVDRLETKMDYLLTAVLGTLLTQLVNILIQTKRRKGREEATE